MSRHHKVHELLDERELEDFRAFARVPARTIDEMHDWLLAKGYTLSRGAVHNWKQAFDAELMQERFSRSGELARAIKGAVKGEDFGDVADAAAMQLTQVVFEQAARLESEGDIDPLDVQRMTRSLTNLVASKQGLVKLLAEKFDREVQARQQKRGDRAITADDIADVRKAIFG